MLTVSETSWKVQRELTKERRAIARNTQRVSHTTEIFWPGGPATAYVAFVRLPAFAAKWNIMCDLVEAVVTRNRSEP